MYKLWTLFIVTAMFSACASGSHTGGDYSGGAGTASGGGGSVAGSGNGGGPGTNSGGGSMATPGSSGSNTGGNSSGSGGGTSSGGTVAGSDAGAADASPVYTDAPAGMLIANAGPPPPSNIDQTLTLTADAFTVAPGDEVYKCQTFPNPFGKDVDLIWMDGQMSQGSHHFFLFNLDPTTVQGREATAAINGTNDETPPTPLHACLGNGIEFHPFPYLSQQPHWIVGYPRPDMGYPLASANALMINVHYLNSSSNPTPVAVKIALSSAKPGVVTTHIGTIFLNNTLLDVTPTPPSSPQPYAKTWTPGSGQLPSMYSIFTSWSHMHRTAVDFTASVNGKVFYEEKNWDSPLLYLHTPAMPMNGSDPITWSCSYYNDTESDLIFGDSAINNVMCIYMGQYYPVVDVANPDLIEVLN
jgi:hypothetical protein